MRAREASSVWCIRMCTRMHVVCSWDDDDDDEERYRGGGGYSTYEFIYLFPYNDDAATTNQVCE